MKKTMIALLACGLLFVAGGAYAAAPRAHTHASISIHFGCRPHWRSARFRWRRAHWRWHRRVWRHHRLYR